MAFQNIMCGFELNTTLEYTGSSGVITRTTTDPYLSPTLATVSANGYIYWTESYNPLFGPIISCNIKLPLASHIKPIKMTRNSIETSVTFDDSSSENRTVVLKLGASSWSYTVSVPANKWINVAICARYMDFGLYIDSQEIHHSLETGSGLAGTITDIRCEAYSGASSSTMYIDDFVVFFSGWNREVPVVMPYIPAFDHNNGLSGSDANASKWSLIDEETSDGDTSYVYLTGASNASGYYGSSVIANPSGKSLSRVLAMSMTHTSKKSAAGTGAETAQTRIKVGDNGTDCIATVDTVTTSYADYYFLFPTFSGGFNPEQFGNSNSETTMQIGIKLTSTAGVSVRTSKLRACVLGLYAANPYTLGAARDIVSTGSWDISFDVDTSSWASLDWLCVYANIPFTPVGMVAAQSGYDKLAIQLMNISSTIRVKLCLMNASYSFQPFDSAYVSSSLRTLRMRIIGHDNYVSVFESGRFITTFSTLGMSYPSAITLYVLTNRTGQSITNVSAPELCDWREATYVDTQTSMSSGIGSVIQERPIEILPLQGGVMDYSYNRTRSEITPANIYRHQKSSLTNPSAGSFYIVNYEDIAVVVDENFMDSDGYTTRVLMMSNLDSGAVDAARIIAQRMREAQETHQIELGPDIRIEPGDKLVISYTLSGTGTVINNSMIAESVNIELVEGEYTMTIGGRKYV